MLKIPLCLLFVAQGAGEPASGKLEIVNVRGTYGYLGAKRPATGVLPGEVLHFSFDVKNLKLDANGRASYSIGIEIFDDKGELVHRQNPQISAAVSNFGGNVLPCSSHMQIPLDAKPGVVKWKVTVTDNAAKQKATLSGAGKTLAPDFGIIQVGTFADREGKAPAPPVGVVGSHLYVHFAAVNFGRKENKDLDLEATLRVLDDQGKPTMPQPLKGHVDKDVPAGAKILPLQFGLTMNRPGHYTIELTARCLVCNKTSTVSFPVRVLAAE